MDIPPKILICHDDADFAIAACETATNSGFQPVAINDGRQFKTAYNDHRPALILHEFFTEFLDGIELVKWLVEQQNRSPVVLTINRQISLTRAAVALARNADLFALSILIRPASDVELADALRI